MRRNRTLRLSEEEIAYQDLARGGQEWARWARRALMEAAALDIAEAARVRRELEERERLKAGLTG